MIGEIGGPQEAEALGLDQGQHEEARGRFTWAGLTAPKGRRMGTRRRQSFSSRGAIYPRPEKADISCVSYGPAGGAERRRARIIGPQKALAKVT